MNKNIIKPDFSIEEGMEQCSKKDFIVVGVDEVGYGAIAGPVAAAAVFFPDRQKISFDVNDSKKMAQAARNYSYQLIVDTSKFSVGFANVEEIEEHNILVASQLAMKRALLGLNLKNIDYVIVDGKNVPALPWKVQSFIGGDGLSISIAAASIIAKVTRDRVMDDLHNEHPIYKWNKNKGYCTKEHCMAMREHGITAHHRVTFASVIKYKN